jgi:hypothetical protein
MIDTLRTGSAPGVSMPTWGVPFTRQVSFPLDISMCRNTENALLEGPCRVLATSRHLIAP